MKGFVTLVFILFAFASFGQKITGFVTDNKGMPLVAATVALDNGTAVYTNTNGFYTLKMPSGSFKVTASFVGYKPQTQTGTNNSSDQTLNFELEEDAVITTPLVVEASRLGTKGPKTNETINDFNGNPPLDVPVLLNQATALTFTSDAGNGVGYTGLRIRGMDGTRINVTVNGVPINDQESHGMFWVNMPDMASSTNNIQVQRGVGTSTNGGQAFGASVNLETDLFAQKPGASIGTSYGSFNTYKANTQFSTGLLSNNWSFQGRLSKIGSDGYIDRATSDLKSFYFAAGHLGKRSSLRFTAFSGQERTYQAWYGVSESDLEENRTSNVYTYENQVDNYQQDHYQLHYDLQPFKQVPRLRFSTALHYTRGRGYYEEYKEGQSFGDYGLNPIALDTLTVNETDLIRQRWLDNHFLGGVYALVYEKEASQQSAGFKLTFGGNYNHYYGDHFGEVIWARYASQSEINHRYYENDAFKRNWNNYLKLGYTKGKLYAQAEAQVRSVHYEFQGISDDLNEIEHSVDFLFINPKASVSYFLDDARKHNVYAYWGISNREPLRNDYVEVEPKNWPTHETVNDIELGYEIKGQKFAVTANAYLMQFKNQLVLNGQINDVGAYLRINVPNSFRRGVELQATWAPTKWFSANGNVTLSQNQIGTFTNYVEEYDANFGWLGQSQETYNNTPISFSPQVISFAAVNYKPISTLNLRLQNKYVGKQYLDNTGNEDRMINAYQTTDFIVSYSIKSKWFKSIDINAMALNVFDVLYESNGWTWSYNFDGARTNDNYYYPQAGRNFMVGFTANF